MIAREPPGHVKRVNAALLDDRRRSQRTLTRRQLRELAVQLRLSPRELERQRLDGLRRLAQSLAHALALVAAAEQVLRRVRPQERANHVLHARTDRLTTVEQLYQTNSSLHPRTHPRRRTARRNGRDVFEC